MNGGERGRDRGLDVATKALILKRKLFFLIASEVSVWHWGQAELKVRWTLD